MNREIQLPPGGLEPYPLDLRWPLGLPLDLRLSFVDFKGEKLDVTGYNSQFVTFPRSRGGTHPYDMTVYDAVNGILRVEIPGNDLIDDKGYNIEVYSRDVEGVPVAMPVKGSIVTYGSAYTNTGPLSEVIIPTIEGPPGPPGADGPAGVDGQRGSIWTTGSGAPTPTGDELTGDMYLDESNGDVWRWSGTMWALGHF